VGAEHLPLDAVLSRVVVHDVESLLAALHPGGPAACGLLAHGGIDSAVSGTAKAARQWLGAARQRVRR
jgi:hypothetical protein